MYRYVFTFFILLLIILVPKADATTQFTVTAFHDERVFSWINGPVSGCSAINSYVMSYPDNGQLSNLFSCGDTFGSSSDPIPDGQYYVLLAVGGVAVRSQVFTVTNGSFVYTTPQPTETPTPTPTISNQPPNAVAGTSLDANGSLQLDASLSSDPEGNELQYSWRLPGERKFTNGKTLPLTNLPSGTYQVTLRVSDGEFVTLDRTQIGIPLRKAQHTISMDIEKFHVYKHNGEFSIKGSIDRNNPLYTEIAETPLIRMTLEVQTRRDTNEDEFSIVGYSEKLLDAKWLLND